MTDKTTNDDDIVVPVIRNALAEVKALGALLPGKTYDLTFNEAGDIYASLMVSANLFERNGDAVQAAELRATAAKLF